jgi:hypothetical protein
MEKSAASVTIGVKPWPLTPLASYALARTLPLIENIFSKAGKFFDNNNHHTRTTQITTIYHQFTTFCTPKTTTKSLYPQTLAL